MCVPAPGPRELPLPHRPRSAPRSLPVLDPQGRRKDRHPHLERRTSRTIRALFRQHPAPKRARRRARGAFGRVVTQAKAGMPRTSQGGHVGDTPENMSSTTAFGHESDIGDTLNRTPENDSYASIGPANGSPRPGACLGQLAKPDVGCGIVPLRATGVLAPAPAAPNAEVDPTARYAPFEPRIETPLSVVCPLRSKPGGSVTATQPAWFSVARNPTVFSCPAGRKT